MNIWEVWGTLDGNYIFGSEKREEVLDRVCKLDKQHSEVTCKNLIFVGLNNHSEVVELMSGDELSEAAHANR